MRFRIALLLIPALAGCAAGPDFKRPDAPSVAQYTAHPVPAQIVSAQTMHGEAQEWVYGLSVDAQWWKRFNAPELEALIQQAFAANPTLVAAQATLRQAQELQQAQAGSTRYPESDANFGVQRQRTNPGSSGQPGDARQFNLYNASLGVRYNLDLAGGSRRALEALAARTDYRRYELAAARLTLAANITTVAISRARLAAQIEATQAILKNQAEQQHLAQQRLLLGQASPDEFHSLQAQTEQTRAGLPTLRKQLQQAEHQLAVLSGRAPGVGELPEFTLSDFTLPARLPLVIPSELVRHRPDIQASEALMHAANADYGVAVAKLYPQINLSANLGSQALTTGAIFGGNTAIWSMIGQLTQPLFNPGLAAEKRAALAALDAASANYQNVVLEALRNVADVLRALENDAETLVALADADRAAQQVVRTVEQRHQLGAASHLQWLVAQQQAEQTRLNLIAAQAQRLADSVSLFQAMGIGADASNPLVAAKGN